MYQDWADLIVLMSRNLPLSDGLWFEIENTPDVRSNKVLVIIIMRMMSFATLISLVIILIANIILNLTKTWLGNANLRGFGDIGW